MSSTSYDRQLNQLNDLKQRLLKDLKAVPGETLNAPPADGGWSAGQIVAHVIAAERKSLEYVQKKVQTPDDIPRRSMRQWLNGVVLNTAMRSPFKFEVPPSVGEPPESVDLDELTSEWAEVRRDWQDFVGAYPPELATRTVYRHPVAGPLTLEQALAFLVTHLQRHMRQIERRLG